MRTKTIHHAVAAALIGASLLSVLLFPTIAGAILQRHASRPALAATPRLHDEGNVP